MQLSAQPQPIAGERPGEDVTNVEAIPLSQQQHPVIASLQTGGGLRQLRFPHHSTALREPDALAVYVKGCKDATVVSVIVMRMSVLSVRHAYNGTTNEFSGGEEEL